MCQAGKDGTAGGTASRDSAEGVCVGHGYHHDVVRGGTFMEERSMREWGEGWGRSSFFLLLFLVVVLLLLLSFLEREGWGMEGK